MDLSKTSDFLLHGDIARKLYHNYAADCPIADYHNHLSPEDIFKHRRFRNLTELWLETDHYKWRSMRACGIGEKYITGDASDYEKFLAWAETVPQLIGNPLYHWTHLELSRYFDINEPLDTGSAERIWKRADSQLQQDGFDAVSLLEKMNVTVLCTTDEPGDPLVWHRKIAEDKEIRFRVLPSFRPDRLLQPNEQQSWRGSIRKLEQRYNVSVDRFAALLDALLAAIKDFAALGCKMADHSLPVFAYGTDEPEPLFQKALRGERLTVAEDASYKGALLRFMGAEYARQGINMQLHLGALRNASPKLMSLKGADCGGDSVGATTSAHALAQFLGDLQREGALPHTILYNLNPADNQKLATMAGNFAPDVQYGAAWWFNDTISGMRQQLQNMMETGGLSRSIGMLTDSRSFTSFVRHEYYRRILCDQLGQLMEDGQYPKNVEYIGGMVKRICYDNAVAFLGI